MKYNIYTLTHNELGIVGNEGLTMKFNLDEKQDYNEILKTHFKIGDMFSFNDEEHISRDKMIIFLDNDGVNKYRLDNVRQIVNERYQQQPMAWIKAYLKNDMYHKSNTDKEIEYIIQDLVRKRGL